MRCFATRFNATLLVHGFLLLWGAGHLFAHAVPSLTVEAGFSSDRSYVLRVSVDPRLILSSQPTSLPPTEAAWYRDQTPEQLKATERRSNEYLASALSLVFSGKPQDLPVATYQAMDGASNQPLAVDSKEVHLLAEFHGTLPAAALDFALSVGKDANTSVILINSRNGEQERRPQVLFPGETSRPFDLPGRIVQSTGTDSNGSPTMPKTVVTTVEVGEQSRAGPLIAVVFVGGVVLLLFALKRRNRR